MINALKSMQKNNKIVSIYCDKNNPDAFSVGHIVDLNEEWLIITSIDEYGLEKGHEVRLIEDIFKLQIHSPYVNRLKKLNKELEGNHSDKNILNFNSISDVLKYLVEKNIVASFWLEGVDDMLSGYVEAVEENLIEVKEIDSAGKYNGNCWIETFEVNAIDIDTRYERKIKTLFERQ